MRRLNGAALILGMIGAATACGDQSGANGPAAGSPVAGDVNGSAQKGPFSNGSQVTISELDANLVQTGRAFSTTMNDDGGAYSVRGVQLGTPYARVEVNGFYFDEVRGQLSASPLSIFSYVDLTDRTTSNINLLGHLEAARLEHLVAEQGVSFGEAKARAHREVLEMFELDPNAIQSAEDLDISRPGDGNAALFAISVMLQGTRTVAELSELLSNIQSDLKEDGTLDNPANGSAIMGGAMSVDLERARQNLAERFDAIGVEADVPGIDEHITRFTEQAPYEYTGGGIEYPIGTDRPNVLDPGITRFDFNASRPDLNFMVNLPDATEVKIRITNHMTNDPASGAPLDIWYWSGTSSPAIWSVTQYDFETGVQEFSASNPGLIAMPAFMFGGSGSATVEYFEYGSDTPTRTKEITWSGWDGAGSGVRPGDPIPAPGSGGSGGDGSGGSSGYGGSGEGGREGEPPPSPYELCGNGSIDMGEECDGADLGGQSCQTLMPGTVGELRCMPDACHFDRIECERPCGNGVIDDGEACDPGIPPGGCAHCTPECQLDTRACEF